ncbi:unnamed protein product [Dicrocoelium dendriticum]|nr:unnamed protein product [Dicrocoelium dendriticum]
MKIDIRDYKRDAILFSFSEFSLEGTIKDLKMEICSRDKKFSPHRVSLRTTPSGTTLADSRTLQELCSADGSQKLILYLRDLGPQVGWRTVFVTEYTGPFVIYLTMWLLRQPYLKMSFVTPSTSYEHLRLLAVCCWCGHYAKRILETLLVHRFSHATMPLKNLYRNSAYYYLFALFVSYFVNHPLYTFPAYGYAQVYLGLAIFLIGEYGNFCCHLALKNLRPAGSTIRKIPHPVPGQYLTRLFNLVACPNYTYEVIAWIGFSIMTQSLPAALFTFIGFCQMTIWALKKLKAYRREFKEFPRNRRAIVPYVL